METQVLTLSLVSYSYIVRTSMYCIVKGLSSQKEIKVIKKILKKNRLLIIS